MNARNDIRESTRVSTPFTVENSPPPGTLKSSTDACQPLFFLSLSVSLLRPSRFDSQESVSPVRTQDKPPSCHLGKLELLKYSNSISSHSQEYTFTSPCVRFDLQARSERERYNERGGFDVLCRRPNGDSTPIPGGERHRSLFLSSPLFARALFGFDPRFFFPGISLSQKSSHLQQQRSLVICFLS